MVDALDVRDKMEGAVFVQRCQRRMEIVYRRLRDDIHSRLNNISLNGLLQLIRLQRRTGFSVDKSACDNQWIVGGDAVTFFPLTRT